MSKHRILIAAIGGASLGTELLKCLAATDRYRVFGCDISNYAFGHYQEGFEETAMVSSEGYEDVVLKLCLDWDIEAVIPGGEGPLVLLGKAAPQFEAQGIHVAANDPQVIATCSDKARLFERLSEMKLPIPATRSIRNPDELDGFPMPCIVKPATESGGSSFVFLAADLIEATLYVNLLLNNGKKALVQEYIPVDEGEFTIGVLSLPNGRTLGAVAMNRLFHAKLSVLYKSEAGLVSTGYSQGLIEEFPRVCAQAEALAEALGSRGPLNIQGRVRDGVLYPFEINPRFSASSYLRTMAGFNEADLYLRSVLEGEAVARPTLRPGVYLRSLSEQYIPLDSLKQ
jgi:carbamoyl-phosphate synthase large subunit